MPDPLKPIAEEAKAKIERDMPSETITLTQEKLQEYWDEMLSEKSTLADVEKIRSLLQSVTVELSKDEIDTIVLNIEEKFTESELKQYQSQIMTHLRNRSGNKQLQMKTSVKPVQREAKIYGPKATYDEMIKINPRIAMLREMMNTIDY